MQDVCVSFWPEGEFTNDMIAKVTDICSTDPSDPTHCATPSDIKVDRAKVQVMYDIPLPGSANAALQAPKYIKGTYWHLTKCWGNVRKISSLRIVCSPICPPTILHFCSSSSHTLTKSLPPIIRLSPSPPTETIGGPSRPSPTISRGTSTPLQSKCKTTKTPTPPKAGPPTPTEPPPTQRAMPTSCLSPTGCLVWNPRGLQLPAVRVLGALNAQKVRQVVV